MEIGDSDEILSYEDQMKLNDSDVDRLCNFSDAELTEPKAYISLIRVKELAIHLSLNRCFKKSILTDNIIKKRKRMVELAAVHVAEDIVLIGTHFREFAILYFVILIHSSDQPYWLVNMPFRIRRQTSSSMTTTTTGVVS